MQLRCIRAFGVSVPGDLADVPDGASFDGTHWELAQLVSAPKAPPEPQAPAVPEEM